MNNYYEPNESRRIAEGRNSFSGRPLSNAQFDEGIAIVGVVKRHIHRTGTFTDKLGDYAYAFARTEKFDVARAETILRDLFKVCIGKTMNQLREELAEREAKLTRAQTGLAYDYAIAVGKMIEEGDKISLHRAVSHQAEALARELNITDAGAKRLMKEEFEAAENLDFYAWGKDIEDRFYRPQIEAERQRSSERKQETTRGHYNSRSQNAGSASGRDGEPELQEASAEHSPRRSQSKQPRQSRKLDR